MQDILHSIFYLTTLSVTRSPESAVGIATGYGLDG
jgi:hypothetical protein